MFKSASVDADLVRSLAARREGSSLDFKRENVYLPPPGGQNKRRFSEELAKDLAAMANRVGVAGPPGYLLVGVAELSDGTGQIVGVKASTHLDDAAWHQKVHPFLNRVPDFTYHTVSVDGAYVGVFEIRGGLRPFYLVKERPPTARIRDGSSTAVATPDQVAEWVRQDLQAAGRKSLLDAVASELLETLVALSPPGQRPKGVLAHSILDLDSLPEVSQEQAYGKRSTQVTLSAEQAVRLYYATGIYNVLTGLPATVAAGQDFLLASSWGRGPFGPSELQLALRSCVAEYERLRFIVGDQQDYSRGRGRLLVALERRHQRVKLPTAEYVDLQLLVRAIKRFSAEAISVLCHVMHGTPLEKGGAAGVRRSPFSDGQTEEHDRQRRHEIKAWLARLAREID